MLSLLWVSLTVAPLAISVSQLYKRQQHNKRARMRHGAPRHFWHEMLGAGFYFEDGKCVSVWY